MSITTLTPEGIKQIVSQTNTPTILQVINLQPDEKLIEGKTSLVSDISDGFTKVKCYWANPVYDKIITIGKEAFDGSIVKLTTYVGTPKNVLVEGFDLVYRSN